MSAAAKRYAKALLTLANEQKVTDKTYSDMTDLSNTIEGSKDLRNLITSPVVSGEKKKAAFKAIFGSNFSETSSQLIDLLANKNRISLLPAISKAFIELYKEQNGIVVAKVTSAVPLTEVLRKKVLTLIKHDSSKVEIIEEINPTLIGGFIVNIGDKQIDASIATKFKQLRQQIILN